MKATPLAEMLKANAPKPVVVPATTTAAEEPVKSEPPKPAPPAEPLPNLIAEIKDLLATLGSTAKGAALANGIRKMFKLKADEEYPAEVAHHQLFVNALKDAVTKV